MYSPEHRAPSPQPPVNGPGPHSWNSGFPWHDVTEDTGALVIPALVYKGVGSMLGEVSQEDPRVPPPSTRSSTPKQGCHSDGSTPLSPPQLQSPGSEILPKDKSRL